MTQTALQDVVTTNVKVLMAVKRIEAQKDLAAKLGWVESKLTKSLRGTRKWSLEDLPELAEAFGVQPADLIGDVTHLVNVARPAMTGTDGTTVRATSRYQDGISRVVVPFPQVKSTDACYRRPARISMESRSHETLAALSTGHPFAAALA